MNIQTFFDMLALPLWLFLIIDAIYEMKNGRKNWRVILRIILASIALIVDSYFVLTRF